jgi:hypothetical protein
VLPKAFAAGSSYWPPIEGRRTQHTGHELLHDMSDGVATKVVRGVEADAVAFIVPDLTVSGAQDSTSPLRVSHPHRKQYVETPPDPRNSFPASRSLEHGGAGLAAAV